MHAPPPSGSPVPQRVEAHREEWETLRCVCVCVCIVRPTPAAQFPNRHQVLVIVFQRKRGKKDRRSLSFFPFFLWVFSPIRFYLRFAIQFQAPSRFSHWAVTKAPTSWEKIRALPDARGLLIRVSYAPTHSPPAPSACWPFEKDQNRGGGLERRPNGKLRQWTGPEFPSSSHAGSSSRTRPMVRENNKIKWTMSQHGSTMSSKSRPRSCAVRPRS